MAIARQDRATGLVRIRLARVPGLGGRPLRGARLSYSTDGGSSWRACSVYPGEYPDALVESSFWEWNEAVEHGNLKVNGKAPAVYWNLHANQMDRRTGSVLLRMEMLLDTEVLVHNETLELRPVRCRFWDAWGDVASGDWKVVDQELAFEGTREPGAVVVKPRLKGTFDVWLGVSSGSFAATLRSSAERYAYPVCLNIFMSTYPEMDHKKRKEILWKRLSLQRRDEISIRPHPSVWNRPERYSFGRLAHLRFVPVKARSAGAPRPARRPASWEKLWQGKHLALYFEPYSWAYVYGLTAPAQVRDALAVLKEMGADEIHTQVIRFGSRSLHHGNIAERHDAGMLRGDDGTYSSGPTEMVKSIDVLKESIAACAELGLEHYANAGLTNCYPGTALEDRISREHPEWRSGGTLRYGRPETVRYAAAVMAEFVQWGSPGVSVDCMRYPYHHTDEELLELFREMHRAIGERAGGRKVPLACRIPAGDVLYYRVFRELAREGIVSSVIPSTLFPREPRFSLKPYLLFKDYGCSVYGRVDGWKQNLLGNNSMAYAPREVREDIATALREGADGIFVYQADTHLANPFLRNVFR